MVTSLQGSTVASEYRRLSRILQIVQDVAHDPSRWSRRKLADQHGVTERQIQKDLDVIRYRLGLELEHDGTGYYFERMPCLPALSYSFSEALALLLAARASQQLSGIDSAELAAAIARLETLFPADLTPLLRQMLPRPATSASGKRRQEMLTLISRALVEERKLCMMYETGSRGGEANERVVLPYHLMPYLHSWQLIAYCEWRQAVLMFKVDRIHEAKLLDERYRVPENFDLDEYMGSTWGLIRGQGGEPVDVVLRFEPDAARWAMEDYWHPSQEVEERDGGSVLLKLHIAVTAEFVNWILFYGRRVEVLEPPELRNRVVEEHRLAAAIYKEV